MDVLIWTVTVAGAIWAVRALPVLLHRRRQRPATRRGQLNSTWPNLGYVATLMITNVSRLVHGTSELLGAGVAACVLVIALIGDVRSARRRRHPGPASGGAAAGTA
jgi:hypothetical protein